MATGLQKSSASTSTRSVVAYDQYVDQQLAKVMSYVRLSDLATGLLGIATFLVGTFLLLALVDHWLFDLGRLGRLLGFVAIGLGVLAGLLRLIVPLITRRVNPAYAAYVIEEGEPRLKNSLLNYIFLRRDPRGLREIVYSAVEQQAATKLSHVDVEAVIDHTPVVRTGIALAGLVVAFGLYLLISPKNPLQTAKRVVLPWADAPRPSRVKILEVQPGDTEIYAGRHVTISAQIENLGERDEVELIYNSLDGQIVDRRTQMTRQDEGRAFAVTIPETSEGLFQDLMYRITAGDAEAGPFRIKVKPTPSLNVREIVYEYPAYTSKAPSTQVGDGNIRAVEGTRVTVRAEANQPIEFAYLEFDPDEPAARDAAARDAAARDAAARGQAAAAGGRSPAARDTIKMKHEGTSAEVTFTLLLGEDSKSSWHDRYRLRFTNASNETNEQPIVYDVHVIPDLAPQVDILTPEKRQVFVAEDQVQPIEVRALDPDFGLTEVELKFVRAGNSLADVPLLEAPTNNPVSLQYHLTPQQLGLHAGDSAVFWAVAKDNRRDPLTRDPSPRESKTMEYELRVLAPVAEDTTDGQGQADDQNTTRNGQNVDEPSRDQPQENNPGPENNGGAENSKAGENQDGSPQGNANDNAGGESGGQDGAQNAAAGSEGQAGSNSSNSGDQAGQQSTNSGQEGAAGSAGNSNNSNAGDPTEDQTGDASNNRGANSSKSNGDQGEQNGKGGDQESSAGGSAGGESPEGGEGSQDSSGASSGGDNASSESERTGEGGLTDGSQPSGEAPRNGQATGQAGRGGPQVTDVPPKGSDGAAGNRGPEQNNAPQGDASAGEQSSRAPGANQGVNPASQKQDPLSTDGARDGEAVKRIWDRMQEKGAAPPDGKLSDNSKEPGSASDSGANSQPESASGDTPENQNPQNSSPTESGPEPSSAASPSAQENKSTQPKPSPQGNQPSEGSKPPQGNPSSQGGKPQAGESPSESAGENGKGELSEPGAGTNGEQSGKQGKGEQGKGEQGKGEQGKGEQGKGEQGAGTSPARGAQGRGDAPGGQEPGQSPGEGASAEGAGGKQPGATPGGASGGKSAGGGNAKSGEKPYPEDVPPESSSDEERRESSEGEKQSDRRAQAKDEDQRDAGVEQQQDGADPAQGESSSSGGSSGGASNSQAQSSGNESSASSGESSDAGRGSRGSGEGAGDHSDAGEVAQQDEANLDYARRATDLVLDYLKHDQNREDRELLDRLGWKQEDLREFVKRWEQLKQDARRPDAVGDASRRELDDALRGLGLAPTASRVQRAGNRTDRIEGVQNSGRNATAPSKYREQWQEFRKSLSGAR
jgi:hypothetical protein